MKPVFMDTHIELHEKMLNEMQRSFKKLKKRIHKVELNLHLVPPDNEPTEKRLWKARVDKIINEERVHMNFPNLSQANEAWEKKHPPPIYLSNGEFIVYREQDKAKQKAKAARQLPLKTLKKLNEVRETKYFGPTKFMGALEEGHELKTIKNYSGCNTFNKESRVLVRKDARIPADVRDASSLPTWFGPGTYDNIDPKIMRLHDSHTVACRASFEATERHQRSAEELRDLKMTHRDNSLSWKEMPKPERFASDTRSNSMHFAPRATLDSIQWEETQKFEQTLSEYTKKFDSVLGVPILESKTHSADAGATYKIRDWTMGGLSLQRKVFDNESHVFNLTHTDYDQVGVEEDGDAPAGGVTGAGGAGNTNVRQQHAAGAVAGAGNAKKGVISGEDGIICSGKDTPNRGMSAGSKHRLNPLSKSLSTLNPNPTQTQAQTQPIEDLEPWNQPIDYIKILRRNETNKLKHSFNKPIPTYRHKISYAHPDQEVLPKEKPVITCLDQVPLKGDISGQLKDWMESIQFTPNPTLGSPHKLHPPLKPRLNTNNLPTATANIQAAKQDAKKWACSRPTVDSSKSKFAQIENDLDGILIPGAGVDPDGSAGSYSPPVSARGKVSEKASHLSRAVSLESKPSGEDGIEEWIMFEATK